MFREPRYLPPPFLHPAFELRPAKGTFSTVPSAFLPNVTGDSSYITGLVLSFGAAPSLTTEKEAQLPVRRLPGPDGVLGRDHSIVERNFAFAKGRNVTWTLALSCGAGVEAAGVTCAVLTGTRALGATRMPRPVSRVA
jgi:hypothetical protein